MMTKLHAAILAGGLLLVAGPAGRAQEMSLPLCCTDGVLKPDLAPVSGVDARLSRTPVEQGGPSVKITFGKPGDERRFVALDMRLTASLSAFQALDMRVRVTLDAGLSARPALLAYESGGGAWFRTGRSVSAGSEFRDLRMSLQAFREAAFSDDSDGVLDWGKINRIWIGILVDGRGTGSVEFARLTLTSEPFVPSEPVSLFSSDPAAWGISVDPAVEKTVDTVTVDGATCLRLRFTFPGGRHMYLVPSQPVGEMEYSAYAGIRLTYKASVPAGIDGLLVSLFESGGQFVAQHSPKATGEWMSVTIPFEDFKLPGWSKDNNGRFDVDLINRVSVGAHGTASGKGGAGEIVIKDIEVVPAAPK
jgi:hypothetical protein